MMNPEEFQEVPQIHEQQKEYAALLREGRLSKPAIRILPNTRGCIHLAETGISASPDVAEQIRIQHRPGREPVTYIPTVLKELKVTGGSYHIAQIPVDFQQIVLQSPPIK